MKGEEHTVIVKSRVATLTQPEALVVVHVAELLDVV